MDLSYSAASDLTIFSIGEATLKNMDIFDV